MHRHTSHVVIYLAATLLLVVCITNYWLYDNNIERIVNSQESKAQNKLRGITDLGGYYISHYEHELLEKFVLNMAKHDDVLFISVRDLSGGVGFEVGRRSSLESRSYSENIHFQDEHVGFVELSIADTAVKQQLRIAMQESVILLLISVSLIAAILFFFFRSKVMQDKFEMAEGKNEAKSEFLSHMSHELRTPMNAILGFGQMLELDADQFNETQRGNIKEILNAGHHLLNLINEVLDLSKIESNKLEVCMEKVTVDDVIRQCIALIQPLAASRHLELTDHISGKGDIVRADTTRLKQVLMNLLSNAVKYNREHGRIILESESIDKQCLRIRVTDTGEGLTAEDITRLFIPFERLNAVNNIEGTGIGLVISKHLIELMGGSIGVESVPGEGCRFWVDLSLAH